MNDYVSGDVPSRGVIPPMRPGAVISNVRPLDPDAALNVNAKCCRNCCYGPKPLCTPERTTELEGKLAGRGFIMCHNSPHLQSDASPTSMQVVCRGYFDAHRAEVEAARIQPPIFVSCPDILATKKPNPISPCVVYDVERTMTYNDEIAAAKQRAADLELLKEKHRAARVELTERAAKEVLLELERQATTGDLAGKLTVSIKQPLQNQFWLSLTDRTNGIQYELAGSVEYGDHFDEPERRCLRTTLVIEAGSSRQLLLVHFRDDGSFEFDLSSALTAVGMNAVATSR